MCHIFAKFILKFHENTLFRRPSRSHPAQYPWSIAKFAKVAPLRNQPCAPFADRKPSASSRRRNHRGSVAGTTQRSRRASLLTFTAGRAMRSMNKQTLVIAQAVPRFPNWETALNWNSTPRSFHANFIHPRSRQKALGYSHESPLRFPKTAVTFQARQPSRIEIS